MAVIAVVIAGAVIARPVIHTPEGMLRIVADVIAVASAAGLA